jgi:hypothetical protein
MEEPNCCPPCLAEPVQLKAIEDQTIPVAGPPIPVPPDERNEPKEAEAPHEETSVLGQNVGDFEIDVPPPEGI